MEQSQLIDEARLAEVLRKPLLKGYHTPDGKMCVMEAAAYISGERWSDAPECVCPVIRSFMISWNDSLPADEDRGRLLKPFLAQVVNTKSTSEAEERRSYMAIDWLIRVHTTRFLDLTDDLKVHAKALRDLDEITDLAGVVAAGEITSAALSAADSAALSAARSAALSAARSAARSADYSADRSAADSAARSALQPTVEWLQKSASDLLERMINCSV